MVNPIPTVAATAGPAPASTGAGAAAAEPGAFARELDRAAAPGDAEAEPAPEAAAPPAAAPAGNARAKARAAGEARAGERRPERAATARAAAPEAIAAERSHDSHPPTEGGAAPNDLQALLASLMAHLPAAPHAATAPASAAARAEGVDAAATGAAPAAGSPGQPGPAAALPLAAEAANAAGAASAAASALPAFGMAQATGTPAVPAEPAAPPPVHQAQVHAALGTPEFAPGLSAEVNVMLRDGLQEARLQLNPAEMGPITVQIQIEGSNAQIHFSAEQAPTREALEQALPTLAGTLQDSGLTLTGGGVFEQPRPPRDDPAPAARPGGPAAATGADDGPATALAGAPRRLSPRGVVDLYA